MSFRRLAALLLCVGAVDLSACSSGDEQAAASGDEALKALARASLARTAGELSVPGLAQPVEVIRDQWGVAHVYAQNTDDLFFAQGYVLAQDRLWQMEWWRRTQEGRLAEVLGPEAFERDRQRRLLMYRGPMTDEEWTSYHPEGKRIFTAYANGVNAFIQHTGDNLPVEFKLTGIRPEPWTPETVVLRNPAFGDATNELRLARSVAELGLEEANRRSEPDPWDDLKVPEGLDVKIIGEDIVRSASAGPGGQGLPRPAILPQYVAAVTPVALLAPFDDIKEPGSNNWVVSGALTDTGKPYVVNDPHREVTLPSLRYIVHLNAPGWNVVGAAEPPFVGVHIGHSERLGWGLTIVGTDQHDVYVEEVNPANPNEVRFNGQWEAMKIVREEIKVNGEAARPVELKFSRHGPVFFEDQKNHRAYALRSALNEPGTAPYLAGLRLSQAQNCKDFLEAAMYWKSPSENLICGDVEGNISWQASALTPTRKGWVGRLPVPGTGTYEWQGFRTDLPRELNPERGFVATANHNIHPPGYAPPIMFKRPSEVDRIDRILQILKPGQKYTVEDHKRLQHDQLSLQAQADLPLFRGWTSAGADVERARQMVASWDGVLSKESTPAAIYQAWQGAMDRRVRGRDLAADERQKLMETALQSAVAELTKEQGADWAAWRWGKSNARSFPHPVVEVFDLPTVERGGGGGTVAANGASYREIFDVSNWDRSLVVNVPGQSGQPESPYYSNLLQIWSNNEYFPLAFTREAVEKVASQRLTLQPGRVPTQ